MQPQAGLVALGPLWRALTLGKGHIFFDELVAGLVKGLFALAYAGLVLAAQPKISVLGDLLRSVGAVFAGRHAAVATLHRLRELDLTQRPSRYEPDELPGQVIDKYTYPLLSVQRWAGNRAETKGTIT
jgi:hypothetical protein